MIFRVDDDYNKEDNIRYQDDESLIYECELNDVNYYIAMLISDQVNGKRKSQILSYSKSLGVCLAKYNRNADNGIRISVIDEAMGYNTILFDDGNLRDYDIENIEFLLSEYTGNTKKKISNFVIDISNNMLLDEYLSFFARKKRKWTASPEKDLEVLIFNPAKEVIIKSYIDEVYLLYALNNETGFMKYREIACELYYFIRGLDEVRFYDAQEEREALCRIIYHLHYFSDLERKAMYRVQKREKEFSMALVINPLLDLLTYKDKSERFENLDNFVENNINSEVGEVILKCFNDWRQSQRNY